MSARRSGRAAGEPAAAVDPGAAGGQRGRRRRPADAADGRGGPERTDGAPTPSHGGAIGPAGLGRVEFTALLAMAMALTALGIDLMLPAFPDIRDAFGLAPDSTAVAGVVTAYFLGLAIGQLAYGPLADRFGRRPALYAGFAVYAVASLASALAPSLLFLYGARFVWGLGAAGSRVVAVAVVRDTYEGDRMSRAMSFIMAVFILVPVVAPSLGAVVVAVAGWRWVFGVCTLAVAVMLVWARRLPETLRPEDRLELRFGRVAAAGRVVVSHRLTVGYTLAMTAAFGAFASYLSSSEIVIGEAYGLADAFPIIFGGLAAVMGVAMLVNARLVERLGTRRLSHGSLVVYVAVAAALSVVTVLTGGTPPIAVFVAGMALILVAHAFLIPNFNAIAMQPMGAVAGMASSLIGATQVAGGAVVGAAIDRTFDGTARPLVYGFLGSSVVCLAVVLWTEHGRLGGRATG